MTAFADKPLQACLDALPNDRTAAIGLVTHTNVAAWHADEQTSYIFVDARGASHLKPENLLMSLQCCACGKIDGQVLHVDCLFVHDATPRMPVMQADERALVFFYCVECRDAAHFAVGGIAGSLFETKANWMFGSRIHLHVTYESLCAARHIDRGSVGFDYLTRLRVHPYVAEKRVGGWSELATEHKRCASARCGSSTRPLELLELSMVYGADGQTVDVTFVACAGSAQCAQDVRQDLVAGMKRSPLTGRLTVVEERTDGKLPVLDHNTCAVCSKRTVNRCGGCKEVRYCTPACQAKEWRAHKRRCRAVQRALASKHGQETAE